MQKLRAVGLTDAGIENPGLKSSANEPTQICIREAQNFHRSIFGTLSQPSEAKMKEAEDRRRNRAQAALTLTGTGEDGRTDGETGRLAAPADLRG